MGRQVLADREAELRLVDLHPARRRMRASSASVRPIVAAAPVPQLDRDRVAGERLQQPVEIVARRRLVLEAGGKLRQQRPELARRGQRIERRAEARRRPSCAERRRDRRPSPCANIVRVREFLIELERELEARRRALGPAPASRCRAGRRRTSSSPRRCRSARHRRRARRTPFAGPAADRRCRSTCPCPWDSSSPTCRCARAHRSFPVHLLVEAEDDLRPLDQDRPLDQVRVLHHQVDRFLLRPRQRPLLEDRAARADEIEKCSGSMCFSRNSRSGGVLLMSICSTVDALLVQETSGVLAGRSGGFGVEGGAGHGAIVLNATVPLPAMCSRRIVPRCRVRHNLRPPRSCR